MDGQATTGSDTDEVSDECSEWDTDRDEDEPVLPIAYALAATAAKMTSARSAMTPFRRNRRSVLCGAEVSPGSSRLVPMMSAIACSAIASKRRWWRDAPDSAADRSRRRGIRSGPSGDTYRARTLPGGAGPRVRQRSDLCQPARTRRAWSVTQDAVPSGAMPGPLGHRDCSTRRVGACTRRRASSVTATSTPKLTLPLPLAPVDMPGGVGGVELAVVGRR